MSPTPDVRWQQRLTNLRKAVANLDQFLVHAHLNEMEEQGLIQAFECAYELAWNTLRDYLVYQGITNLVGSRDTFRSAFSVGLIDDGQAWLDMLTDRNRTSHTYDQATAKAIGAAVRTRYHAMFHRLVKTLDGRTS